MHFNMKHFVVTIVSIFLALGIGIAIGATIDGQQLFIEEQGRLVEQIEKSIENVKEENYKLEDEKNEYKNKLNQINKYYNKKVDSLVKANPLNKRVLVIDLLSEFNYYNTKDILNDLDAQRVDEVLIKSKYDAKNTEAMDALKEEFGIATEDSNQFKREMLNKLFAEEENFDRLERLLRDIGFIDVKGSIDAIKANYDVVVIADGNTGIKDKNSDGIRKTIIDNLGQLSMPMIAVEDNTVGDSYIEFYKDNKVSTVDNLEEGMGKLSFLLLLDGETGNYGFKQHSDNVMPLSGLVLVRKEESNQEDIEDSQETVNQGNESDKGE